MTQTPPANNRPKRFWTTAAAIEAGAVAVLTDAAGAAVIRKEAQARAQLAQAFLV